MYLPSFSRSGASGPFPGVGTISYGALFSPVAYSTAFCSPGVALSEGVAWSEDVALSEGVGTLLLSPNVLVTSLSASLSTLRFMGRSSDPLAPPPPVFSSDTFSDSPPTEACLRSKFLAPAPRPPSPSAPTNTGGTKPDPVALTRDRLKVRRRSFSLAVCRAAIFWA